MSNQEILDWEYNVGARFPSFPQHLQQWQAASAEARNILPLVGDLIYGSGERERLDFFRSEAKGPILAFFHGGYWQSRDKAEYSCFATPYVTAGINVAIVNYPLVPTRTLPEVVESCRGAVAWLAGQAKSLSGANARIFVAGHSAGGHLASMMAATDWHARGFSESPVGGFCSVSGIYDLEPLSRSYVNSTLNLTAETCSELSPSRLPGPPGLPGLIAVGGDETPAFLWQQNELLRAWADRAKLAATVLPAADHFTTFDAMWRRDGRITAQIVECLEGA